MKQSNIDQNSNVDSETKGESTNQENHFIGHYQKAPSFMKDNEAITHGYRINFNTPKKIIRSLFMVHNQSVNIWTHLAPAIVMIAIIVFYIVVIATGKTTITNQLISYKQSFQEGFNNYFRSMENITLIQQMYKMKDFTAEEFQAFKASAIFSYQHLTNQVKSQIDSVHKQVSSKMSQFKQELIIQLKKNLFQMEKAKHEFEKIILPKMFDQINQRLNSTVFLSFKAKIQDIKKQIDSDTYKYIQLSRDTQNPYQVSRWPIFVFLASAVICLMCSAVFHLCYPMSPKHYKLFSRLDYAGVSILIAGSGFPIFYYGMYCNLYMVALYLTVSTTLGIAVFGISLTQWFHRPEHLHLKGWTYALYGIHYVIPASHMSIDMIFFDNYGDSFNFLGILPALLMCAFSYLFGVYVYVKRCPERKNPGKYNICGHSHQIWHLCVVMGVVFTYIGVLSAFDTRKGAVCPINA